MPDQDAVRRIALSLPGAVHERGQYRVAGKGFAWNYPERVPGERARVERTDVLVVRVPGEAEKAELLAADPDKFFTTNHYNGYAAVMVRLDAIDEAELTELLTDAWRSRAPRSLLGRLKGS